MEIVKDIHSHCEECIKTVKCRVPLKSGVCCEIVNCHLACGARFHACKADEHGLLCPYEKVPCLNSYYGCPCQMLRMKLAKHLSVCPASIVHCTMEWKRWPLNEVSEKRLQQYSQVAEQQYSQVAGQQKQQQLDVAFVLRDQRILRRYNCVEAHNLNGSSTRQFDAGDVAMASASNHESSPPGLERSVCNQLCQANAYCPHASSSTSKANQSALPESQNAQMQLVYEQKMESLLELLTVVEKQHKQISAISKELNGEMEKLARECVALSDAKKVEVKISGIMEAEELLISRIQDLKSCVQQNACNPLHTREADAIKQVTNYSHCNGNSNSLPTAGGSRMCTSMESRVENWTICHDDSIENGQAMCLDSDDDVEDLETFNKNMVRAIAAFPTRYLGIGVVENDSPQQPFVKEMHTVYCSEVFRRDEYPWHYKNVHSEIQCGLNGWLQERCPLAQYGCPFSRQIFNPHPEGSRIVYNEVIEAFGHLPPRHESESLECPSDTNSTWQQRHASGKYRSLAMNISDLPFELLRYIAGFLDSFGLCNLSLTSSLMRDVCQSLLIERGIVTIQWIRKRRGDRFTWIAGKEKWCFTTHFTPITKWNFDSSNTISNHLKNCICFERIPRSQPFCHLRGYFKGSNLTTCKTLDSFV